MCAWIRFRMRCQLHCQPRLHERVRKLRFFQPHQYVSIDYTRQDVIAFHRDAAGGQNGVAQPPRLGKF